MSALTVTRLRSRGASSGRNHRSWNSNAPVYSTSPGETGPTSCATRVARLSSAAGSIGSSGGDIAGSWSCRAEELQNAYRDGQLKFFGEHAGLSDPTAFADWLAPLRQCEWVVYAKRPFTGPKAVLAYLSRYTHRVAISNSRLLASDDRGVTFRWKD